MKSSLKIIIAVFSSAFFMFVAHAQHRDPGPSDNLSPAIDCSSLINPVTYTSLPAYKGNRTVSGLQYSLSGMSGNYISRSWIMAHPQLTASIAGYKLLSYDIGVLPRNCDYISYGTCAADSNLLGRLVQSYAAYDSTRFFLENLVVERNGQQAKVSGAGSHVYFILVQ